MLTDDCTSFVILLLAPKGLSGAPYGRRRYVALKPFPLKSVIMITISITFVFTRSKIICNISAFSLRISRPPMPDCRLKSNIIKWGGAITHHTSVRPCAHTHTHTNTLPPTHIQTHTYTHNNTRVPSAERDERAN